jgi:hypothetical protein
MEVIDLIRNYLKEAKLMQIATVNNDQPWACSVYFAYDDVFNLYWISTPSRRHSQEIEKNQRVAGTIVLSHTPGDKVRGIQFQGIAQEGQDKTKTESAMKLYATRFTMSEDRMQAIIEHHDNHVCYGITSTMLVLFDEVNFPDNPRQEFRIESIQ